MRAVVQTRYGSSRDLKIKEVPRPVAGRNQVLVHVQAASVHADVWHVIAGRPYILRLMGAGFFGPRNKIPGIDMAGVVTAVGSGVTSFKVGDRVFGETQTGSQWTNGGAYADYVAAPADAIAIMPDNFSFVHAAALPTSGLIVLQNLRNNAEVKPGQKVLINGAGGSVGMIAVQIAVSRGGIVTAVDTAEKFDLLRRIGATEVIDYTVADYTNTDQQYDVIFDIPGNYPFKKIKRVLKPDGAYVLIGHDQYGKRKRRRILGSIPAFIGLLAGSLFNPQLKSMQIAELNRAEFMAQLRLLAMQGAIDPIIAAEFPLESVREAIAYLTSGLAMGKIVLVMNPEKD